MIKRTLLFQTPAHLFAKHEQLKVRYPEKEEKSAPIEDLGIVILEHPQISITNVLLEKLMQQGCAVITCDSRHMPTGLMLPLEGHSAMSERFRVQMDASEPLKKNLWKQTVERKVLNQAAVVNATGKDGSVLRRMAQTVQSGDKANIEGKAAAIYWRTLFGSEDGFYRDREGPPPNHLLNYGYAVLRAVMARSLIGSGLQPILGIHHRNKYNAYCLADDIMEPYRPYVDMHVIEYMNSTTVSGELNTQDKQYLLQVLTRDVVIDDKTSPLLVACSRTSSSVFDCLAGNARNIAYPIME